MNVLLRDRLLQWTTYAICEEIYITINDLMLSVTVYKSSVELRNVNVEIVSDVSEPVSVSITGG